MQFGTGILRLCLYLMVVLVAAQLAACKSVESALPEPDHVVAVAAPEPDSAFLTSVPASTPFRLGLVYFNRGDYGWAERSFREAVEEAPTNVDAWIGLAATYDHIKRFDLADRAYQTAIRLSGETPQILNNQGYSYLLRGDRNTARAKFRKALERDPNNHIIINNIEMASSTDPFHQRTP